MPLYGSLHNRLMEDMKGQPAPVVGMGATITLWSDRVAATIVKVTAKTVTVQEDRAIRTDSRGMTDMQEYRYEPNPAAPVRVFRLTMRRGWRDTGGSGLVIGTRMAYHDYSF